MFRQYKSLVILKAKNRLHTDVTDAPHVETAVLFKWGLPLHQLALHLFLLLLGRGTWSTWGPWVMNNKAPTH